MNAQKKLHILTAASYLLLLLLFISFPFVAEGWYGFDILMPNMQTRITNTILWILIGLNLLCTVCSGVFFVIDLVRMQQTPKNIWVKNMLLNAYPVVITGYILSLAVCNP